MSELYMMISVTGRRHIPDFTQFYEEHHIVFGVSAYGAGTAASEVLDYFGLEDDEKGVFFCVVTKNTWKELRMGLRRDLKIDAPGIGIVFLVPLSSIGGKKQLRFLARDQQFERGDEARLKDTKYELIMAIANYGYNDMVMEAAKSGGASGGTVLHGKGVGLKEAEQFFGVSFVTEKEIILIVARTEQRNAIMRAVMEKAGTESKAGTILFSLPVTDTAGLKMYDDPEEIDDMA